MFKKQWAIIDTDQNKNTVAANPIIARFWTEKGAKRRIAQVVKEVKASNDPMAYLQLVKLELCYKVVRMGSDITTEKPKEVLS